MRPWSPLPDHFSRTMKKATIEDIAAAAGVSTATVSRVINGESHVSARTRAKVDEAIARFSYSPNLAARNMGGARSMWIALLYHNPGMGFMHLMQSGALDRCREAGFMMSVHSCDIGSEALERELTGIVDQLRPWGVILPPPLSLDARVTDCLRRRKVPFVRLCPRESDERSPRVWFDDRSAVRELTEHLLGLGHRQLSFVAGLPEGTPDPRHEGYLDAVRAHRLAGAEREVLRGDFSFHSVLAPVRQLLSRKRRPTALVAANDDMAAACIHAAHDLGLRVPQDLSVTGFDDSYVATILSPSLTTVHAPIQDLGATATDLLIKGPPDMDNGLTITRPHRLVIRQSSGPCPG